MLKVPLRGGLAILGEITLCLTVEPIQNARILDELDVVKSAKVLLLPVFCRRKLFDLTDDMAAQLHNEFYQSARDVLMRALAE